MNDFTDSQKNYLKIRKFSPLSTYHVEQSEFLEKLFINSSNSRKCLFYSKKKTFEFHNLMSLSIKKCNDEMGKKQKKGTQTDITTDSIFNIDTDADFCWLYRIYSPESEEMSNNPEYAQCSIDFWQNIGYYCHYPFPFTHTDYHRKKSDCSFCIIRIRDEEGWSTQMNAANNNNCFN